MIPRHIPRSPQNDNYRALALYVADAKEAKSEKALMSWHDGCAGESYAEAIIEVEATQAMNARTRKEKTYHLMVSFRPEDEAALKPEIFKEMEREFARALGFEEHQRHCGVHKNTDNIHLHIAYNMIHPETFNRYEPFRHHRKIHEAARLLEKKYGLKIDKGIERTNQNETKNEPKSAENLMESPQMYNGAGAKKHPKAGTIEAHSGQQSFYNYAASRREIILEAAAKAPSWEKFHEELLRHGLELKARGNGLVIKDRFGKHAAKASDIDRSLSKGALEKRFGRFIGATEKALAETASISRYAIIPLHKNINKNNLFAQFQAEMEQRKAALAAVKEDEGQAFEANKKKWAEKRKLVGGYAMLAKDRRNLLLEFKAIEEAELAANRIALAEKKKAIREALPYTSWTKFLQHQAARGNETALEVLRSKKLQPEIQSDGHDNGAVARLEATRQAKARQVEILKRRGLTEKHRQALLAVEKMKEVLSKDFPEEAESGIKSRIDTKGTIIFSLKSGGAIRDAGSELHFSPHDQTAKKIAEKYALMKWGRQTIMEGNTVKTDRRPKQPELSR